MILSNKNKAILEADRRGYHCDQSGNIYNPEWDKVEGFTDNGYKNFCIRLDDGSSANVPFHRFITFQLKGDLVFPTALSFDTWTTIRPTIHGRI